MIESNVKKDLERKIDLYINGQLTETEIDELWAELIEDDYYLDYTKSFASLKSLIENERGQTGSSQIRSFRKVIGYASAAAVILFIGIFGVLNFSANNQNAISALDTIPLDSYRNAEGTTNVEESDAKIREAIVLANSGDIASAIDLLNTELDATEDSKRIAKIGLSLGAIQYNSGDYFSSVGSFELVVSQSGLQVLTLEQGYFYLGNAYFQLDDLPKAKDAFEKTFSLNGQYQRVANNYIQVIDLAN